MDLKRAMLLRLARRNTELYPSDPVKREMVYNKYKVVQVCSLSDTMFVGTSYCTKEAAQVSFLPPSV